MAEPILLLTQRQLERFLGYLERDEETGCLLWQGTLTEKGYGRLDVSIHGTRYFLRTHRIAWVLAGNTITAERPHILHNCPAGDWPSCCEVSHLWAGTNHENRQDMVAKQRGRKSALGLPYGVKLRPNGRYQARPCIGGRHGVVCLGTFDTIAEAEAAVRSVASPTA